jgi:hypothetical protein
MHKELIERLRAGSGGMKHWQELESEAADAIEALQATATEYQQAADKMAMEHKIERDTLRQHIKHIGNDALRSENHELRQRLAEAQALIEASRKQEPVAWFELNESLDAWFLAYGFNPKGKTRPLYAAPVVVSGVQRDAERWEKLCELLNADKATVKFYTGSEVNYSAGLYNEIDKAMKGAE